MTHVAPHAIQWLSDNGPQYTATASVLYAHEPGLVPITTPGYSPESNGLAEGFVHTFKRDYVSVHELHDAETVLAQLGQWFDDYNRQAPHSALGVWSFVWAWSTPLRCRVLRLVTPEPGAAVTLS